MYNFLILWAFSSVYYQYYSYYEYYDYFALCGQIHLFTTLFVSVIIILHVDYLIKYMNFLEITRDIYYSFLNTFSNFIYRKYIENIPNRFNKISSISNAPAPVINCILSIINNIIIFIIKYL